jgi:hypothetical protein
VNFFEDDGEDDSTDDSALGEPLRRGFALSSEPIPLKESDGLWFQIAVSRDEYLRHQRGCNCPIAIKRAESDTVGRVVYACTNTTTNEPEIVSGSERVIGDNKLAFRVDRMTGGKQPSRQLSIKRLLARSMDKNVVIVSRDDDNDGRSAIFVYARQPVLHNYKALLRALKFHLRGKDLEMMSPRTHNPDRHFLVLPSA